MRQRVQIMGVCSILCQNDIWLKEFNDFFHGRTVNFEKRFIFGECIDRKIERSSISLATAAFIDVSGSWKEVAASFMDGNRTNIGIVIKTPLNAIAVMGIGINIHDARIVLAFQVVDGN